MTDFPSLHSALQSFLSDRHDAHRHLFGVRDNDTDNRWDGRRNDGDGQAGFDIDANGPDGPRFNDADRPVDGRWNQDDGRGPQASDDGYSTGGRPEPSHSGDGASRSGDPSSDGDVATPDTYSPRYGDGTPRPETARAPSGTGDPWAGGWMGADAGRTDANLIARLAGENQLQRPGDSPLGRSTDVPSPSHLESSIIALQRELRDLPPETLRQLRQMLTTESAQLQRLPANAEALADLVARTMQEQASLRQPSDVESRQPAGVGTEAACMADARQDTRLPAEVRMGLLHAPPSAESRTVTEPAGSVALQSPQHAAMTARLDTALLQEHAQAQSRQEGAPGIPGDNPLNTASGASDQNASLAAASRMIGEQAQVAMRADGNVLAGDRGGLPALPGHGAAVAAGVTLTTVANPAGTTYAVAPQTPPRPRKPAKEAERGNDTRSDQPDAHKGRQQDGRNGKTPRHAEQDGPRRAGGTSAEAHAPGQAAARALDSFARQSPRWTWLASLLGTAPAQPQGHAGQLGLDAPIAGLRRSRRWQWLYWSLIGIAYACLGASLATLAPGLFNLPIAAEDLPAWRNGMTAAGVFAGLWAWLLARRMR